MRNKVVRGAATVLGSFAVCWALAGCGGGGMPANAVAEVGGTPISKAALEHWTAVELATNYDSQPLQALPRGVVYTPASDATCVALLRLEHPKLEHVSDASVASKCISQFHAVQEHVLNILIVFQWYLEEAAERGIKIPEAEVRQLYARLTREHFPHPGDLQRYLTAIGERFSDELTRMRMDVISIRLFNLERQRFGDLLTVGEQQGFEALFQRILRKRVANTSCRRGYITPNCKEYRGPEAPDPRI